MDLKLKRVMVIEDEEIMSAFLMNHLRRLGMQDIHTFKDGTAALQALAHLKPDLVFTDVHMQPMGGIEFLQQVRNLPDPALKATKVIFLSADASAATVGAAMPLGVSGYIVKPPSLSAVAAKIGQALRE